MERVLALGQDMALLWTRYAPLYLSGVVNTLLLAVAATVLGCLISAFGSLGINLVALHGFSWENVIKAIMGGDDVSRISVIPWWLFAAATVFSIAVGVLAGFGPANKAVKIPALDAIKNEQ